MDKIFPLKPPRLASAVCAIDRPDVPLRLGDLKVGMEIFGLAIFGRFKATVEKIEPKVPRPETLPWAARFDGPTPRHTALAVAGGNAFQLYFDEREPWEQWVCESVFNMAGIMKLEFEE